MKNEDKKADQIHIKGTKINLDKGVHSIKVEYFKYDGESVLEVLYKGPDTSQ